MLLVDHEILDLIESGALKIDPFDRNLVNPCSLDFRLGRVFGKTFPTAQVVVERSLVNQKLQHEYFSKIGQQETIPVIDPLAPGSFDTKTIESDRYVLFPGEFIIATTAESYDFAGTEVMGIASKVAGKSSCGRLGIAQSSVAGLIDPGFFCKGVTLEIYNYNEFPILLSAGMKIGQFMLFRTEVPNKDYSVTGRYQGQAAGTGSKGV